MSSRVLVVEDEILIAFEIESILLELGHRLAGVAADSEHALELADGADLALVDINLRDGRTGEEIGRELAQRGIAVTFMSSDPSQLAQDVPGTLGIIAKPLSQAEVKQAVGYAEAVHDHAEMAEPPRRMRRFPLQDYAAA